MSGRRRHGHKNRSDDVMHMYASLDLHKTYSQAVVMEKDGTVDKEERIENSTENMERFSDELPLGTEVVIESSSTWYWVYQILSKKHRVILANPVKTKAIASAKLKTDRIDALKLADLLRGGYIAESYIPPRRTIELRELVRYRVNLVRMRTNVKNRIHAFLLMNNVRIDAKPFTKEFVEELRKIDDVRVRGYLRVMESLDAEIHEASRAISKEAAGDEGARLLMTIPGVSFYSALLIVSEIGEVNRFPDSDSLVAYAGLIPSTHSSGGKTYHGRITKTGSPYLRWIVGQCTKVNVRTDPDGKLGLFYSRLARRKGNAKATVAASAKMLRIVFWMLRDRQPYHG